MKKHRKEFLIITMEISILEFVFFFASVCKFRRRLDKIFIDAKMWTSVKDMCGNKNFGCSFVSMR